MTNVRVVTFFIPFLHTPGFGGTLTEEDPMEKHLLPTLSKMTNQSLFLLLPRHTVIDDTRRITYVAVHTATSHKVTTRIRGHDTKSTFWPTLCLLYTVILIQELRSRTRDANTLAIKCCLEGEYLPYAVLIILWSSCLIFISITLRRLDRGCWSDIWQGTGGSAE